MYYLCLEFSAEVLFLFCGITLIKCLGAVGAEEGDLRQPREHLQRGVRAPALRLHLPPLQGLERRGDQLLRRSLPQGADRQPVRRGEEVREAAKKSVFLSGRTTKRGGG